MNITDVRFESAQITKVYFNNKEVTMPTLSFGKLFNYKNYLNIHTIYDYRPNQQYYCRYIKLKPNTTYVVSVSAAEDTGLVLINNKEDVYQGAYIDLRKTEAQTKQYTTNELGYLYLGCSAWLSEEQYNKIISTRTITIKEK